MTLLIFLAIDIAMAFVVNNIAKDKGLDARGWVTASLICWPVALIMVASKPKNSKLHRRCPDCGAEDVPYNVPVCRHCGRDERKQTGVGPGA